MKKNVFIFLSIISFISCTKQKFILNGRMDDRALNGKTIFIKERIDREWFTIDSTTIKDQQFQFKGIADSAKIVYLSYEQNENNRIRQAFVLENGDISVKIDSAGFMNFNGTEKNNLLQTYQNQKNDIYQKQLQNYNIQNNPTTNDKRKIILEHEMDSLNLQEIETDKKYSIENVNSLVGTHIFMNSFFEMNTAEKESVVTLMTDKTKNIKRIAEIISDIETEKNTAVGCRFTNIALTDLKGDTLQLEKIIGKTDYILVDFWASWCGPCIQSLPKMKLLYDKYGGKQLEILGVSLDKNKEDWQRAINNHQLNWKHVSDLNGWKSAGAKLYAINSIPATVLIDKHGTIIGRNLSISDIEAIIQKIDK